MINILENMKLTTKEEVRGVHLIHQNRPDPTQLARLGQFLGLSGLGWVTKYFLISIGLGLGHKISNLPNPT